MKRALVFLLPIFLAFTLRGQVTVRFNYNRDWQLTKKDSAVYFRVGGFDTTSYTFTGEVRDFTHAGKLTMTGTYKGGEKNGEFIFYYANGNVESRGHFFENYRLGTWKYFYPNSFPRQEVEFVNDNIFRILYFNDSTGKSRMRDGTGFWREEHEQANHMKITNEGQFKNYLKEGEWKCIKHDGQILFTEKFKNGEFIKGTIFDEKSKKLNGFTEPVQTVLALPYKFNRTEKLEFGHGVNAKDYPFLKRILPLSGEIFSVAEVSAYPEGGLQAFYKAIDQVMKYPPNARKLGIEGRVTVEFLINVDGSLSDFKVLRGLGQGCDEEAVRVIRESTKICKWKPGMQKGSPVRQRYTLPIIFKIG